MNEGIVILLLIVGFALAISLTSWIAVKIVFYQIDKDAKKQKQIDKEIDRLHQ